MKTKTIIIIGVAVVLVVCVAVALSLWASKPNATGPAATATGEVGAAPVYRASQVLSDMPTGTMLAIGTPKGTVSVNNFYRSDPFTTDGGETVILASTTDYVVTYDTLDSSFWVGIDPDRLDAVRPAAQDALLSLLGVSSTDACKLNVSVGSFYRASSSLNGRSLPLSFCQ